MDLRQDAMLLPPIWLPQARNCRNIAISLIDQRSKREIACSRQSTLVTCAG